MTARTWLITGVSSGFGHELATQLLERGECVIGTVRSIDKVAGLIEQYPDTFNAPLLDVTDTAAVRKVVDEAFAAGRVDVLVSNAGYGLFGAAEELTDAQVDHIIATNLTSSITLIRAALPHLRAQGGGRVIQLSSYGGQVAFAGNSLHHAAKWGIEGFVESAAQKVAGFGIGIRSSSRVARAPSSATAAHGSPPSPRSTTTLPPTPSRPCSTPRTVWPPATPGAWPPASSNRPTPNRPHYVWSSDRRPWIPPSTCCASGSTTSKRSVTWRPPRTTPHRPERMPLTRPGREGRGGG